jgi:phosphoribosylformylglycinamidine synthase
MNENFKKLISQTENLGEIAELLMDSTELLSNISHYQKNPVDSLFSKSKHKVKINFNKKGDTIYLLGNYKESDSDNSSDLEVIYDAIDKELLTSAHTIFGKGLYFALLEACSINKVGFDITSDSEMDEKEFLFNDAINAVLISVSGEKEGKFVDFVYNNGLEITLLGHVTKGELRMDDLSFGYISDYIE